MSTAASSVAPARAVGGTGLVLPPEGVGLDRRLVALRRAEAWRLLKGHAASGERAIARPLAELARSAPDVAVEVLMEPSAAVLARCGRSIDAADSWALELARHDALPERHEMRGRRLLSSALGLSITWDAGTKVALSSGALEVSGARQAARSFALTTLASVEDPRLSIAPAFRALRPGISFATIDANPLAMLETHPDKGGNALSLGGRSEDEWTAALDAALSLVERHLLGVLDEMRVFSMLVIPVGHEPEKHLSASYREYVGACYLTLHPDPCTLAEALVHEFQHNKANLASYHDPLLEDALGTMVRSPVRPDLRPIWGVLLAVHAFVAVAELYRRMRDAGDARITSRLADVIARNDEALRTLREHARPTRIGAALLEELEALHAQHLALDLAKPEGVSWDS